MQSIVRWLLCCSVLSACALDVDSGSAVQSTAEALSVTGNGISLDLRVREVNSSGVVLEGRVDQALASAMAFVPDDQIGTTTLTEQGFMTTLPLSEVTSRLLGSPLLFSLDTVKGQTHYARASIRLGFSSGCGKGRVRFDRDFANVLVDGTPNARISGRTSLKSVSASAQLGEGDLLPTWQGKRSGDSFWIDLPVDVASAAAITRTPIDFELRSGRATVSATCTPRINIADLALSQNEPYDQWPTPPCSDALRACLAAHPRDTASCGDPYTVRVCGPRPQPAQCGASLARWLDNTMTGTLWMSETDAPFEIVALRAVDGDLTNALRSALNTPADATVETRSLDDVLAWPSQDRVEDGPEERLRAAHYRTLYKQLTSWLRDVQVVRIGTIRIDVYFVGRDACGKLVGLKTRAVET